MTTTIRKFARRSKGLEALQAVLLVGVAFLICTGLTAVWNKSKADVQKGVDDLLKNGAATSPAQ
ncbi:MAG: hypothetical protein K1X57_07005 [Gemmataceae bacterium]|nr:hypothetical protein [Gemmataceae bacterium]